MNEFYDVERSYYYYFIIIITAVVVRCRCVSCNKSVVHQNFNKTRVDITTSQQSFYILQLKRSNESSARFIRTTISYEQASRYYNIIIQTSIKQKQKPDRSSIILL
jgi:hypothetical protein